MVRGVTSQEPQRFPQEIYVRRRVAAAAVLVVLLVFLAWLGSVLLGGDDSENPDSAAVTTTSETTSSTPAETTTATTTETSTAVTSSEEKPTESTQAAAAKTTCELGDLELAVRVTPTTVTGNQQPEFFVDVKNPTKADCVIDTSEEPLRFEVYDLNTNQRLWSDIDCNRAMLTGEETFKLGRPATSTRCGPAPRAHLARARRVNPSLLVDTSSTGSSAIMPRPRRLLTSALKSHPDCLFDRGDFTHTNSFDGFFYRPLRHDGVTESQARRFLEAANHVRHATHFSG